MSKRSIKIGLIGLGSVAEIHLKAYRQVPGMEVIAGADIDLPRLEAMSQRYRFRAYRDYRTMIAEEDIDAVCVLTPPASHCDATITCAKAGLNVLCEKPLATTMQDAELMVNECDKHGTRLFYGASYRFLPALMKSKELIRESALGHVVLLSESIVGGSGIDGYEAYNTEHYPSGGPGGPGMGLIDHGIHLVDAFSWLIESPITSVFGKGITSDDPPVTEYMVMNFASGAVGHLLYNDISYSTDLPNHGMFSWGEAWDTGDYRQSGSWLAHPGCIHVYGTHGALRISHYANVLHMIDSDGIRQIELLDRPAPAQFAMQMESFLRCINDDTVPEVSGHDGVRALQALLAVYESDREKRVVAL